MGKLNIPGVGETHLTGLGTGNDTSLGHERVGKGRLAVVDVGNNRHVTDVGGAVHQLYYQCLPLS